MSYHQFLLVFFVAMAQSQTPQLSRINEQLVSDRPLVVHGDLHIASFSLARLASAAQLDTTVDSVNQSTQPSLYPAKGHLHLTGTTLLCHDLIIGSINVSQRVLQLLSTQDIGLRSNMTQNACNRPEISQTTPSISSLESALVIAGTLNASGVIWARRSLLSWLIDIEIALLATTPAPTLPPVTIDPAKRLYLLTSSGGSSTTTASKPGNVNDRSLSSIWQPTTVSLPYIDFTISSTANWVRIHAAGDLSRPRVCKLFEGTEWLVSGGDRDLFATVTFPNATASSSGSWVWAEISPPITKAFTEFNCDKIPGYTYFTIAELELYSGDCPAGRTADTTTNVSQAKTNPSILCV
eukprot:m.290849 g.290849  ORF g.290849 m.290849 type:complete len:352 (+) comp17809_c0_seq2:118-1173(+)